jgi:hypothetical protein
MRGSGPKFHGPIIAHECLPTVTESALGATCRVFSVSYELSHLFHGGNTGSNPVGDANKIKGFRNTTAFLHDPI